VLLWKQSRVWLHQRKLALFHPFLFSSKLDQKICPHLLLVIGLIVSHWLGPEVWKDQFQFTERSFTACNTYNWHCQHYLQSNSKNVRRSPGHDKFQPKILGRPNILNLNEQQNVVWYTASRSTKRWGMLQIWAGHVLWGPLTTPMFHKALDIEQKAKFGQKNSP